MRILISAILFLSFVMVYPADKQRIAVLDFTGDEKTDKKNLEQAYTVFSDTLINARDFIIVERKDLKKIIEESKLQQSDEFDDKTAVEIGNFTGAQVIFTGSLVTSGKKITVYVKGISVESGIAFISKNMEAADVTLLPDTVRLIAADVVNELKGKGKTALDTKKDQQLLEELNYKIMRYQTDIDMMESANAQYSKQLKPVLASMIAVDIVFGLTAVGAGVSFGLFNYFYTANTGAETISDIRSTRNLSLITFNSGVGLSVGTVAMLVPAIILTSYYLYISNYTTSIENKRKEIQKLELEKQRIFSFDLDAGKEQVSFSFNVAF